MSFYNMDAIMALARQTEAAAPLKDELVELPIDCLEDFPEEKHRFKPASPERLERLAASIRENGILSPLLVRQLPEGKYQILAGHNRRTAAQSLGWSKVPCIIKRLPDEDSAILVLIADNLDNRERLLPSEKAFAYKTRLDAMKRQGKRVDLTSSQPGTKLRSDTELSEIVGESRNQVQRYIRLTHLIPQLLELVDNEKIGLCAGEQLSYLSQRSQWTVYSFCYAADPPRYLKEAQARALRVVEEDPDRIIDAELLEEMTAKKASLRLRTVKLPMQPLREYFPQGTPEQIVIQTIHTALAQYFSGKDQE